MFACTILWLKCLPFKCDRLQISIGFVIFRILAKIFETISQDIINECRTAFNLPLVTDLISKQIINFLVRYAASENLLCKVFASNAEREIKALRQK